MVEEDPEATLHDPEAMLHDPEAIHMMQRLYYMIQRLYCFRLILRATVASAKSLAELS